MRRLFVLLAVLLLAVPVSAAETYDYIAKPGDRILLPDGTVITVGGVPLPTATPTVTPAPTATPSASPSLTAAPSSTASPVVPTATPSSSSSPSPTATSIPTTPTPAPSTAPPAPPSSPPSGKYIGPDPTGPTSGAAWQRIVDAANASWGAPSLLTNQDNKVDGNVLAGALVYARTGDPAMRTKVRNAIFAMMADAGTSPNRATNAILSMGRQLGAYVLAADYIKLTGSDDTEFRAWLSQARTTAYGTHGRYKSLVGTALDSPHNWGTFALASLLAADLYLGDTAAVARDWNVYRGYTDRSKYSGFEQAANSWSCPGIPFTPANGGCPNDALRYGAWAKDLVRGGEYPTLGSTGLSYSREIMQGVALAAELFYQNGHQDAYTVIKPAFDWARDHNVYNNHSTGYYISWMVNKRLGYAVPQNAAVWGRVFGYTDWLIT